MKVSSTENGIIFGNIGEYNRYGQLASFFFCLFFPFSQSFHLHCIDVFFIFVSQCMTYQAEQGTVIVLC